MTPAPVNPSGDKEAEIVSLVRRLHELTDGNIDAATQSGGNFDALYKTLEKLWESEDQFRSMFTAAATGIAIYTPQGRYLKANGAYCRMLGYTEDELITRDFASLTHPDDLKVNLELRDDLLAGGIESFVMEKRYIKKTKEIVWARMSISAARSAKGEIEKLMVIAEDITERKKAEEQLQRQRAELLLLFDLMPAMLCIKDTENRFLRVNRRLAASTGKSVEEMEGKSAEEIYPQEAMKYYADDLEVLRTGAPKLGIVEKLRSHDGQELWVQTDKVPYYDPDGKAIGLVVLAQDITARKRAEEAFDRQNSELKALVNLLPASIWLIDKEHRVLRINPRAAESLGKPIGEIEGKYISDLYSEHEAAIYKEEAEDVIRSGIPAKGIINTSQNGGDGERWIQKDIVPFTDKAGQVLGVVYMTQDVTEAKRTEQSLRESDERFRQLADTIDQVFWLFDPINNKGLYVSPGFERIWGLSRDELLADYRKWMEGIHPEDRDRVAKSVSKVANGEASDLEYRVVQPDGSERLVHSRAFPVRDEHGAISRVAGLTEDITERRKMETQILRAQRMESLGTLASGIAHDLNNVLSPILMSVQLMRMEMPYERRAALLTTLETSAQRGADMVKQVLMFARGMEGERVPLKPERLLKEIEHIIRETFPRTITIKTDIAADCRTVLGDLTQMQQALLNLCVNSRDAMPDGGRLTLSAANIMLDEHFVATIPGAKMGPHVVLQVSDTGCGIPANIIDKIFDPFFTTKEVGKGTGLGLSTLQAIVKGHGGFVSVYSEPRRGSTFKLFLPATGETTSQPAIPSDPELPRGNGELLLFADDEEPIRNVARSTLEAFGYRVLLAANGAEAVALFAQYRDDIALIISDMAMPVMDGPLAIASIAHIRQGVPVIASSGLTSTREIDKWVPGAVKAHLQKPYAAEKLLQMVRQALHS